MAGGGGGGWVGGRGGPPPYFPCLPTPPTHYSCPTIQILFWIFGTIFLLLFCVDFLKIVCPSESWPLFCFIWPFFWLLDIVPFWQCVLLAVFPLVRDYQQSHLQSVCFLLADCPSVPAFFWPTVLLCLLSSPRLSCFKCTYGRQSFWSWSLWPFVWLVLFPSDGVPF